MTGLYTFIASTIAAFSILATAGIWYVHTHDHTNLLPLLVFVIMVCTVLYNLVYANKLPDDELRECPNVMTSQLSIAICAVLSTVSIICAIGAAYSAKYEGMLWVTIPMLTLSVLCTIWTQIIYARKLHMSEQIGCKPVFSKAMRIGFCICLGLLCIFSHIYSHIGDIYEINSKIPVVSGFVTLLMSLIISNLVYAHGLPDDSP